MTLTLEAIMIVISALLYTNDFRLQNVFNRKCFKKFTANLKQ